MYKERWEQLKHEYEQSFDASRMKPEAARALQEIHSSLAIVVGRILASGYADRFNPVVSMGTSINVCPSSSDRAQPRGPSLGFTAFTEERFRISYRPRSGAPLEGQECTGVGVAADKILALLERLRRETDDERSGKRERSTGRRDSAG